MSKDIWPNKRHTQLPDKVRDGELLLPATAKYVWLNKDSCQAENLVNAKWNLAKQICKNVIQKKLRQKRTKATSAQNCAMCCAQYCIPLRRVWREANCCSEKHFGQQFTKGNVRTQGKTCKLYFLFIFSLLFAWITIYYSNVTHSPLSSSKLN